MIRASAELHRPYHLGGDPFEMSEARPLDFGHWSAHKLESMTDFELRHGEAVAIGVAVDTVYSSLVLGLPRRTPTGARLFERVGIFLTPGPGDAETGLPRPGRVPPAPRRPSDTDDAACRGRPDRRA